MRGILVALLLVLVGVLVAVLLHEPDSTETPKRQEPRPAAEVSEPDPLPPPPDGTSPPPKQEEPAERVRVTTNVGGATVTLHIHLSGGLPDPESIVLTADADGNAEFTVPEPPEPIAEMIAGARAPGHRPAKEHVRKGVAEITLVPGVPVRGKVVSGAGEPIQGVSVRLPPDIWGHSDASGAFDVWLPRAGPTELTIWSQAWLNTKAEVTAPSEGVEIVLERGLTISGRVEFPDGKPVPGVWLQANGVNARAGTNDDGRYLLAGFESGTVKVDCHAADEKREVEAGATEVDFVVKSHVVRIRFTDEEDRPFRNASVWIRGILEGEEIFTSASSIGEDGIDLLDGVPSGTEIHISPSAPGREEKITKVLVDGSPRLHDVVIVLPREGERGTVSLRVLDEVGDPRSHAVVFLYNEAGSPVSGFYQRKVELDEEGRCRLEVPAGRFTLKVGDSGAFASIEGYALATSQEIVVTAGEVLPVDAAVLLGGRVRLTAEDGEGKVAAIGRVNLFDHRNRQVLVRFIRTLRGGWTTSLDEPGPALLGRPVAPGRYKLRLYREEKVIAEREVDVAQGRTTELTMRLPRR